MSPLPADHLPVRQFKTAARHARRLCLLTLGLLALGLLGVGQLPARWPVSGSASSAPVSVNPVPVTVVSAASFDLGAIAPDASVSAFGTQLATVTMVGADTDPGTPGVQLPTLLGGTTVTVNGRLALLSSVSPGQVNFVVPAATEIGAASVVVHSADGTDSIGTMQVRAVAPAIFTANGDGQGVPVGLLLRVKADNTQVFENISQVNSMGRFVTKPIDLGPEGERVFLVLFASGIRHAADPNGDGNLNESIHVVMGGLEVVPASAAAQGDFGRPDHHTVHKPRSLAGRGLVKVSLVGGGFASNLTEIEITGPPGSDPPLVNSFNPATNLLVGQTLTINGSGFSLAPNTNTVRVSGVESPVLSASFNQLSVTVPFGAQSGQVSVHTPQGETTSAASVSLRTSISGLVENTDSQPLSGAKAKEVATNVTATTGTQGSFVLPDIPGGAAGVEIDGTTVAAAPPYPLVLLKKFVTPGRDNTFDRPISLQQQTGAQVAVGGQGPSLASEGETISAAAAPTDKEGTRVVQVGDVTFEISPFVRALFPNGDTSGILTVSLVKNSRTPVDLPAGVFSSTVVQITPFHVLLSPGGKLSFPNLDKLPAGSQVTLFRFDQTPGSPSLGSFISAGPAFVSDDGLRVETPAGAITETSIFFAAPQGQPTTTVIGLVVDCNNAPVRGALVRARGREILTDNNGGFILRSLPAVQSGDTISVEASLLLSDGRVIRTERANVAAVPGGIAVLKPDILLSSTTCTLTTTVTGRVLGCDGRTPVIGAQVSARGRSALTDGSGRFTLSSIPLDQLNDSITVEVLVALPNGGNVHFSRGSIPVSAGGTTAITPDLAFPSEACRDGALAPTAFSQIVTTDAGVPVGINLKANDPLGRQLKYILVNTPLHGSLNGLNPGLVLSGPNVTYTPAFGFSGTDTFLFKVNNGFADSNLATVTIVVRPVFVPSLVVPGSVMAVSGTPISFPVSVTGGGSSTSAAAGSRASGAAGLAAQSVTLSAMNLPPGASFNQTGPTTGQFSWPGVITGNFPVTFKVTTDGILPMSDTRTVSITGVNNAPILTMPGPQSVVSGRPLSFSVSAMDPDFGQTLNLSAMNLPPGATFTPQGATGQLTWPAAVTGTYPVTFRATDSGLPPLTTTQNVMVTVVNNPPQLSVSGACFFNQDESVTIRYTLSATDPDQGQTLSFSYQGGPSGSGVSFQPGATSAQYSVRFAGEDQRFYQTFMITFRVADSGIPSLSDMKSQSFSPYSLCTSLRRRGPIK